MSKADDIKALPVGSVVLYDTPSEGKVAFLKGIVFSGETPESAEEVSIWVAPNLQTFDEEAFAGEDAPLDDLEIIHVAQAVEDSE